MTKREPADKHFYGRRNLRPIHDVRSNAVKKIQDNFILPADLLQQPVIDPAKVVGKEKIWLEIGFGNGEHLVGQAQNHPDIALIGCEAFLNGVGAAAKDMVANNINNVSLWPDDALPLISKFPDGSLERIFLLFPDPWPKTKHYKRRFIQDYTVALFARLLKSGGRLSLATDDKSLAEWMLLHVVQNAQFSWDDAKNANWRGTPDDWVETRYQQKAAQQGRLAHFLNFTKI